MELLVLLKESEKENTQPKENPQSIKSLLD